MDAVQLIFLLVAGFALCQSALTLVHAWEHSRFYGSRRGQKLKADIRFRVTLIAPCKGLDTDLRTNLLPLFWQRYPNYELCFVVESESDPAVPVILELQREHPHIPSRLVVAGVARDCGQKVQNLMCATRDVLESSGFAEPPPLSTAPSATAFGLPPPSSVGGLSCSPLAKGGRSVAAQPPEVLAFVDSDACPHVDWLARLVERLSSGKSAAATGYRWYVPETTAFPNRLLSAINNLITGWTGTHRFNMVWGGGWAMRVETFRKLGLPDAWQGSLSDDLIVCRLLAKAGLHVAFEPHCLTKSSADFNWARLAEFVRRQFTVVRVYRPGWWQLAFWGGFFTNVSLWGMLAMGAGWGVTRGPWAVAVAVGLAYYLAGVIQAHMAAEAIRPFVSVADEDYHSVARLNIWGWPLVWLASWLGIAAAGLSRTIVWRGIVYRMDSPQQTTILTNRAGLHDEGNAHARTTTRAA